MIKYKVIKSFPSSDAGYHHLAGEIYKPTQSATRTRNLERLGYIEEIPQRPKTVWDLKEGDNYYFIDTIGNTGGCFSARKEDLKYMRRYREVGNCFLTLKEAENELARRKAKQILERDTKGFKASRSSSRFYYVCYDIYDHSFDVGYWDTDSCGGELTSPISFATRDDAEASIKAHPDAWKTYFGVDNDDL